MINTKGKISIFLLVIISLLSISSSLGLTHTNPTIKSPLTENGFYHKGDQYISWNAVRDATYKIGMRDLTTNMKVFNGVDLGTATAYTIPKKYFYEGHKYRIAISATVGSSVTWGERIFNINLSSARKTILSRGNAMINYTWTPAKNVRGWRNKQVFVADTTYQGIPYSQTPYQCSISSVAWNYGSYFDINKEDSKSGFYDKFTSNQIIMPKYGNDCSGFVSTCWNISRKNTTGIASHTRVGKTLESYLKQYARLSPGDALVVAGKHTYIIEKITPLNDAKGNLAKLEFTCKEQTPYSCKTLINYSDACASSKYIGVCKNSTLAQDYSWDWK